MTYATAGRADGSATYTNAEVVATDVIGRTLVSRNAEGLEGKVQLDGAAAPAPWDGRALTPPKRLEQ